MTIDEIGAEVAAAKKLIEDYVNAHAACHQTPSQNTPPAATQPPNVTTVTAGFPPMILRWGNAIKQWEGSKDPTNPGNLKYAPLTVSWGAMKGRAALDGGFFATFKTPDAGYKALCNFLVLACHDELMSYHSARTLGAFTTIYAGNPPQGYKDGIAHALGVPLTTNIASFLN